MSSKPAIVLSTGSFALPSLYDNILSAIKSKGYEFSIPQLCTVTTTPNPDQGPLTTMYDDAALIASEVEKFADQGKDVVILAHSYGGVPMTESVKGLSKKERAAAGKKGGIVRLGYMTALVPEVGLALSTMLEDANSSYVAPHENGWLYHPDPAVTAKFVYNHLTPEEGIEWVKRFGQQSGSSFTNECTYAGYKDVPVSYLLCEDDKCVVPAEQQRGIDRIEKARGKKVDVTRGHYDHIPTVSNAQAVIDWIVNVAEKGDKE